MSCYADIRSHRYRAVAVSASGGQHTTDLQHYLRRPAKPRSLIARANTFACYLLIPYCSFEHPNPYLILPGTEVTLTGDCQEREFQLAPQVNRKIWGDLACITPPDWQG